MSTVFSEVYGTYYNVVAKVLTQALDGTLIYSYHVIKETMLDIQVYTVL